MLLGVGNNTKYMAELIKPDLGMGNPRAPHPLYETLH